MNKKNKHQEKVWIIFFRDNIKEKPSFCFWNRSLEAYFTKKEALNAFRKEFSIEDRNKSQFVILKGTVSVEYNFSK